MAQQCDCASQLSFVVNYYEKNSPAFQQIKAHPKAFKFYAEELKKINYKAAKEKEIDRCIFHLDKYVALLQDHHSSIGYDLKRRDLSSEEKINTFKNSAEYKNFQIVSIDTAQLILGLKSKPVEHVEGIYSDGRNLVFGVIRKKGSRNQYQGIVLKKNRLMEAGHVLLELTQRKDRSFDAVYNIGLLGFNVQRLYKNTIIEHGQMPYFGFAKASTSSTSTQNYEFRSLDDSTSYLRLGSFDASLTKELDSFYLTIHEQIIAKPNLIIDIRSNGGGSESSYFNLLPYAYTNTLKIDSAQVWVSPDNIKRYEESTRPDTALIERMKKAPSYNFIPQVENASLTWTLDSVLLSPKRIALIYNRGSASAAEGMILYFMQSDKVITVGENSGGYIGYGNVMDAPTPCGIYVIKNTTTRYVQKSKYEFQGIPPQFRPAKGTDWIKFAQQKLQTQG